MEPLFRHRLAPWWAGGVVFALLLTGGFSVVRADREAHGLHQRAALEDRARVLATRLQEALGDAIFRSLGLSAFVSANPDFSEKDFATFARTIRGHAAEIRVLALAPGAVVRHVEPVAGNEASVGHDLLQDPARRDAVRRGIDERRFVLAGPFPLRQGGVGLMGRWPLFLSDDRGIGRFWGLVAVGIDFAPLLEKAGWNTAASQDLAIALRGKDGLGSSGDVFFGSPDLFSRPSVRATVRFPNGSWELALLPLREGAGYAGSTLLPVLVWAFALLGGWGAGHVLALLRRSRGAEESLRNALGEKDVLLREIHHRVKNNFAVITSLLTLQQRQISDAATRDLLAQSLGRIRSMALLHEILYRSENLGSIDMRTYLSQLVPSVADIFHPKTPVRLSLDVDPFGVPLDQAIPCGLLVTELLSNAYRHAFIDRPEGHIIVSLHREGGLSVLTVADDGVGFPATGPSEGSLGLRIVDGLVQQLRGSLTFDSASGVRATVRFP